MIVRSDDIVPFDFDGLQIKDYTATADVSSSFATIEVPSGSVHAEAWSKRSDKYYFVAAGAIEFTLDDESIRLSKGDFVLVRQGHRFSYANHSGQIALLILCHTPNFDLASEVFVAG